MYEVLLYLNLAVFALVLGWYLRQPFASVFHPATFYLFFHGLIFVFRPLLAHYRGYELIYQAYEFRPSEADKITVILAAMLGFLAFMFACCRWGAERFRFNQGEAALFERKLLIRPFVAVAAVCLPIAVYSNLATWNQTASGSTTMIMDAASGAYINTTGNGYFVDAQIMLVPLVVLIAWFSRFRWWSILPMGVFLILRAGTGGRWTFIVAAALIGLLLLYDQRRRWPRPALLGALGALLVFFSFVGQDRGAAIRTLFNPNQGMLVEAPGGLRFLEGMDFANLEFFQYIVYCIPQRTKTYGYFLDNLQVLTEPIPRKLWKNKPIGSMFQTYSLFKYGRPVGMTYSLPGEGWAQLGYVGVMLWCGLIGAMLGKLYSWFVRGPPSNGRLLGYMTIMALSLTFFRDGVLITLIRTSLFCFVPIVLMFLLARALGIPSAVELGRRAAGMVARRRRSVAAEDETVPPPRSQRGAALLPPRSQRVGAAQVLLPRSQRRRLPATPPAE